MTADVAASVYAGGRPRRRQQLAVGVLVNNAGCSRSGALETLPMQDLRRQFETNAFGLVRMCQLVGQAGVRVPPSARPPKRFTRRARWTSSAADPTPSPKRSEKRLPQTTYRCGSGHALGAPTHRHPVLDDRSDVGSLPGQSISAVRSRVRGLSWRTGIRRSGRRLPRHRRRTLDRRHWRREASSMRWLLGQGNRPDCRHGCRNPEYHSHGGNFGDNAVAAARNRVYRATRSSSGRRCWAR